MRVADGQLLLLPPVRPLAERLGRDFFRAVPEVPGVYLMSAARDGVLYVGKAKNLRRRLGSYRSATGDRESPRLIRLLLRVERIDWDECVDEAAALVRERELIRTLQPRFNRAGVRPPKSWFLGWRRGHGALSLELREQPGDWDQAHGPFVFARPAFAALLRHAWQQLHPGVSPARLPGPLLTWSPPDQWIFPDDGRLTLWLEDLTSFLRGATTTLPHLDPPEPDPSLPRSFDDQWRDMDAACLAEFYGRLKWAGFSEAGS